MHACRCSVLAAANPSFGSFDDTQDSSEQHEFKATILSRFDLIFLLRDKENYERDAALCTHILNLHAQKDVGGERSRPTGSGAAGGGAENEARDVSGAAAPGSEELIPFDVLKSYIQFAKALPAPLLGPDARDTLKNFYVQTR
ncbi:dna replication licensing factor mcm5 [Cystoisospora suis]|uniref:Dna replication licensing factor mcm5 n=1 Tax=Cystoisospora suis TaxID=483139 RepID=A0A2C6KKE8_9APIC|nr:dna replication licensing factor mcm5 [Cystoisospora suis]